MKKLSSILIKHKTLSLFLIFLFFFAFIKHSSAYWTDPNPDAIKEAQKENKMNAESYNLKFLNDITGNLNCHMGATDYCPADEGEEESYLQRSVLGKTIQGITLVYANPPAGVGPFIADAAMRAGLVDKAYADGLGYSSLSTIIPVWRMFRNLAYVLMIVAILFLGFMIMFRRSLDPQTAITLQNSLPRIIVTIILITFSYAIAGFVIDLMYVAILIVISLFAQVGIFEVSDVPRVQQEFTSGGTWALFTNTFAVLPFRDLLGGAAGGGLGALIGKLLGPKAVGTVIGTLLPPPLGIIAGWLVGGVLGEVVSGGNLLSGSSALGFLNPILILLGIIIFIFAFFRLLFMLISAYIQILINIIFAPLMLISDVLPGGHGFTGWIKNLIGHTLAFPVTVAMILIGHSITRNADALWTPPLIPAGTGEFMQALIGISIIILIPSIVKSVQGLFKAGAPIGVTPGTVAQPGLGAIKTAATVAMTASYLERPLGSVGGFFGGLKGKGANPVDLHNALSGKKE